MLNPPYSPTNHTYLSASERLALVNVGKLALKRYLTQHMVFSDSANLIRLVRDIADAILETIPHLDAVELGRLMDEESK